MSVGNFPFLAAGAFLQRPSTGLPPSEDPHQIRPALRNGAPKSATAKNAEQGR